MKKYFLISMIFVGSFLKAQTDTVNTTGALGKYPEIKGYVGLAHPIYTWSSDGNQPNFRDYYLVGNPWGINLWKSKRFGISFEFTPFFRADAKGSKISNVLFHPGVLYRLGHEFTLIGRAAYETSGRYGFTPILSKVVKRNANSTLFVALLLPFRFGNAHAASVGAGLQLGVGF